MTLKKSFHIITMGCQMNEYDSEYLARSLIQSGLQPVEDPTRADLILLNTCTVRAKPEQKAYSQLGRMAALKKRKPGLLLGVVGCLAQQKGTELMERFPEVNHVMGPRALGGFMEALGSIESGERIVKTQLKGSPPHTTVCQGYFQERVTGYVSIMEGCNNFCSYCIVPYVRGREVSRSPNEILEEARGLIAQGIKEITLLGQNVNSYQWRGKKAWNFAALLHELDQMDGLLRLRFTTSHPKDLSDELISCFARLKTLCPHIHLPFQAGSNAVLKNMKRGYTREKYLELIDKLRKTKHDLAITSDVMVGFPGEKDNDFKLTLDLMNQVQFDALFSFKYSDRKGTFAEKMVRKVPEREKSDRLNALQSLQKQITLRKNRALESKHVTVLVEGYSKRGDQLSGRTGTNKIVNFDGKNDKIGKLVKVKVKRGFLNSLRGELSSQNGGTLLTPSQTVECAKQR